IRQQDTGREIHVRRGGRQGDAGRQVHLGRGGRLGRAKPTVTGAVSRREVPSRGRSTRVLPSGAVQVEEFPLRKLAARTIRNDEFAATAPVVTPSRLAGYSPSAASDRRGSVDGSSPEPWPTRMRPARDSATATRGALARRCARDAETA